MVSKIGLGTVEIGLPYGIGPNSLPGDREAEAILKSAVELGITYFDTARGYGIAEERLGKSGIGKIEGVVIGTKCAQFLEKGVDPRGEELRKMIFDEVDESLRMLKLETLPLLQLHGGSAEQIKRGELIEILRQLKDDGKIQHAGMAVRGEATALAAIESGFFETIQLAYSILDQRMAQEVLPQAREKNIGIINRSVLLKGALTSKRAELPKTLAPLKANADKAQNIADELRLPLPNLAVSFAAAQPAISTILIGTTKTEHLKTALAAAEYQLSPQTIAQLAKLGLTDPAQVDPAKW